jgi:hypothetical protein
MMNYWEPYEKTMEKKKKKEGERDFARFGGWQEHDTPM